MRHFRKVVIVTQHYPPDQSTTAVIMQAIASHLAHQAPVLVLSGSSGSTASGSSVRPTVVEVKNRISAKAALIRRGGAEVLFTLRIFLSLLAKLQRGDVVLIVTAPFMLPYAAAAAACLKRAGSVLIMHDLYPEVLVMSGLLKPQSVAAKTMRWMNALMFRALSGVVVIGRDTEKLLLQYGEMMRAKVHFIPNWATLPAAVRPIAADNPYRKLATARFLVGLSGNLGFTHDPVIVFEAARLLRDNPDIHFLLSGWGIGFDYLKKMQSETRLPNVAFVDRVPDQDLETFLSAANVWVIPYRQFLAGVSVPSRFYNLLAIGRPVVLVSEPQAEAAQIVREHDVGWVVTPGRADELAKAISIAASSPDDARADRAADIAQRFNLADAMESYAQLVIGLLRGNS
ncbi:MAG: glycosyltransferase family 4 protein [Bradyrhizobium sp.]|nr:glycosyltransferase family 4 protein [Bradyrhizobium sp.]